MPQADDLVKTGIRGLDDILLGGIPRGNVVVVAGSPGTGKTTLGIEFIYRGAREFDEPGSHRHIRGLRGEAGTRPPNSAGISESWSGRAA